MTKRKNPSELKPRGRRWTDGTPAKSAPLDPAVPLQLTVLGSQKQWLTDEAKRQGVSISELIRRWIDSQRTEEQ